MHHLPSEIILFDTEFTSWEGTWERDWSGPGEHREIVQIGAIRVDTQHWRELGTMLLFVKPKINPELSAYFTNLTGITQTVIDENGIPFPAAIETFAAWCAETPLYSWGSDWAVLNENCELLEIPCPIPESQASDIRGIFREKNIPV